MCRSIANSGEGNGTGNKGIKNKPGVPVDCNANKGKGIANRQDKDRGQVYRQVMMLRQVKILKQVRRASRTGQVRR